MTTRSMALCPTVVTRRHSIETVEQIKLVFHKTGSTLTHRKLATPLQDRVGAIGKMHKTLVNRQTNGHTHHDTSHHREPVTVSGPEFRPPPICSLYSSPQSGHVKQAGVISTVCVAITGVTETHQESTCGHLGTIISVNNV